MSGGIGCGSGSGPCGPIGWKSAWIAALRFRQEIGWELFDFWEHYLPSLVKYNKLDLFVCTSTSDPSTNRHPNPRGIWFQLQTNKIIKIIFKIRFMKTLGKNKTGTGPCKSPSPDLHNRSIIKGTTIEVDNIKSKMKEARERQQLFELESSFSQNLPSELNASY